MSVGMCFLAILDEDVSYGLRLKQAFEAETGGIWPLNAGQVYTTLDRLERDGLVRQVAGAAEGQKRYELSEDGRRRLGEWFDRSTQMRPPSREELVLKLVMAARRGRAPDVIQSERKSAIERLQEYTRLKRDGETDDLGWAFLLDSLIFQTEARVRWLDACEARYAKWKADGKPVAPAVVGGAAETETEVVR